MSQGRLPGLVLDDRERDGIGPVNLRAEIEARELEEEIETLTRERTDLEEAIARLRAIRQTLAAALDA